MQAIKPTIYINLFGTPCAGKTTGALYITSKLKMAGINAEYVPEVAKEWIYSGKLFSGIGSGKLFPRFAGK